MNTKTKIEIKGLSLSELEKYFISIGEKKFRASQVFNWIYNNLATRFEDMGTITKSLRKKLENDFTLESLTLETTQSSNQTKTKKFLYKTKDGHLIETVLIPDAKRNTLCISSQVGCPLDCKFCATGLMGFKRNLTMSEIVDQYLLTASEVGKNVITNIVFMGMGEPLLNFQNTLDALGIFTGRHTNRISRRRITVSTSGIPEKIIALADSNYKVKLALSLHSPFDDVRSKIMPVNSRFPLSDVVDAIRYYGRVTDTRVMFEYTMLKGINDRDEDVKALTKLCRSLNSKLNVIPFNSIAHMSPDGISRELVPTSSEDIKAFVKKLSDNNVIVIVRDTQGDDIAAACGQLATESEK
ncbi:MAG: 23S rRNA (adenine(2503)-C(2))-methyltransferase RlmN [Melioribacteraceae bacterium]|jgi:23S rRNA (adenine2503-C2)-methyltransferase|nr:23S rRNA (adenine(2503)-C(2))-methyltransferase RlmN [Melioribacteraceae bacterium]